MGIDLACGVVLAIAFFRGYNKGLIMAVFTIAGYVIGVFATMHLSFLISDYLSSNFNIPGTWLPFLAFALTFSAAVLIVNFIGKIIEKGLTRVLPTSFNRFLGSILYLGFAIILLSMIYEVATTASIFKEDLIASSFMAPHLETFTGIIEQNFGGVIPFVKNLFNEIDIYFQTLSGKIISA
jgi:membrane protein required for colicin V production